MTKEGKKQEVSSVNGREIVLDLLLEWEKEKIFSHKLIRDVLDKYDYLSGQEKAFIKRLAEGTIERGIELDYIIDSVSSVPVKKMKPLIRCLMRMSVYQIFYMDSVPDAAAVSEAVKLAGKRKFQNLKGFVNGVLRNVVKQKDKVCYPDMQKEPVKALSVKYSMPLWLVTYLEENYGREKTAKMLEGLMNIRPVTIRFAGKVTEQERALWIEEVKSYGIEVREQPYLNYTVDLYGVEGVASLPGYGDGMFTVQDVSSMLAVEAAGIKSGDVVIDVCAAPGGKTMLAAEKVMPEGVVHARDVSEQKVWQIEDNLERMGLTNVKAEVYDATVWDESMVGKADVVIADVPCSGLGVMGKKRDIKYHITPDSLESLGELQKEIISNAVTYVKEDGILLYSTCTVNKKENEDMVEWICAEYGFVPENMEAYLPTVLQKEKDTAETIKRGYVQLFPGIHLGDGFFFARLRKAKA